MTSIDIPSFNINKDINIQIYSNGNACYFSIYNDRTDTSISFEASKDNSKGLADFIYRNLENNND
jgi:hypothetical protein